METIIIKPSRNPVKGNAKSRYKARRAAAQEEQRKDMTMSKKIDVAISGCSERTLKAITSIDYKMKPARGVNESSESGAICIPNVAIYAAGHRKCENITCRGHQKFKGKSIPLV